MISSKRLKKLEKLIKGYDKGILFPTFIIETTEGLFKSNEGLLFLNGEDDFTRLEGYNMTNIKRYDYSKFSINNLMFLNRPDGPYPLICND